MYLAQALVLRDGDRSRIEALTRGRGVSATMSLRARVVLLASDGVPNVEIGRRTGLSGPTVLKWRSRYAEAGVEGLKDAPRPGRVPVIDELAVITETLADSGKPPAELGISHWSVRLMAARLGISFSSVGRIWRKWKIQPHRLDTFKFSTDPELEARLRDVVGLYMSPPENAVVVSVDEKSQIQALDRTRPDQPLEKGRPAARTHDYKRNGTTTLFAALDIATGKLSADACYPKHTNAEFVDFLGLVQAAHPDVELHVVCDNYATHKHPNVKAWLAENPRVTLHFTPTSCSWLNMVEIFFGIITKQAIRRGSFHSVGLPPVRANGVDWEPDALEAAVTATGGYPYFIQACGSHVWAVRATDTITLQDAQIGIESARTEVEQGLYRSRWERATPTQRAFMSAMAIDDDAPSSMAELVTRLGKKRTTDLSVNRRDLIRSGHIYTPERGFVAFTVPGMADFIARQGE